MYSYRWWAEVVGGGGGGGGGGGKLHSGVSGGAGVVGSE